MEIKTLSQADRELKRINRQIGLLITEDRRLRERISNMTGATSTTFWLASGTGGSITAGAGLAGGGPLPGAIVLSVNVGSGLEISADTVVVDLAATSGLSFVSGDLQVDDSIAGAGLGITSKVLAVGVGDGIDVSANAVAVDVTDFIDTNYGLTESSNDIRLNIGDGLEFDGGALEVDLSATSGLEFSSGDLQIADSIAGAGLAISSKVLAVGAGNGLTVNANDVALTTPGTLTVATSNSATGNHTHAVTTSSNPGVAAVIVATSASGLVQLVGLGIGIAGVANQIRMMDGGVIRTTSGPFVTFDDTNNFLEITSCYVGIGATNPSYSLTVQNNVGGNLAFFYRNTAAPTSVGMYIWLDSASDTGYEALRVRRDAAGEHVVCQFGATDVVTLQYANSRGEVIVADGGYVGAVGVGVIFDDTSDEIDIMDGAAVLARFRDNGGICTFQLDPANAYSDDRLAIGSATISVTATGNDNMVIRLAGAGDLVLDPDNSVFIGDSTAYTPSAFLAWGLKIDQATGGTHIIELDSTTDVAHGCTTLANTQTYGVLRKIIDASGGLALDGYTESQYAIALTGRYTTASTGKTTAAAGAISLWAQEISGTGITDCTANQNILVVKARRGGSDETVFIIDEDGDTYRDGTDNTFDEWDDVQLVRAFDRAMAPDQVVDSQFDQYVKYHRRELLDAGILTDPNGMFYNESKLIRLHNGAIWQLWQNFMACAQALADLGVPMAKYLPERVLQ